MGSSGAGKTTLMDVLSNRKTIGTISGTITLNGLPLDISFERITGYVEQMDVHNPEQTVREALRFSALMRQEPSVPTSEKYAYVEKILDMMEMTHLGDALIGSLESGLGISVEERKRLTIGMELVGKPKILFLDEPTSGLDAQSSYNIVKFLRKLANHGMPLVCTIHQPSSILFEHFDRLLLLARGGRTVYFGDIGKNSRTLLDYFETRGARACAQSENPAEYILQVIGAGTAAVTMKQDWADLWEQSDECHAVDQELASISSTARLPSAGTVGTPREFATGEWFQFIQVYRRMNRSWWRDPEYNLRRFLQGLFVGALNGISFWQVGKSSSDLLLRVFSVFQVLVMGNSLINLAQPMLMKQRQYFRREYASKFYGWRPFALSIVLTEMPYLVITSVIVMVTAYWSIGLETDAVRGLYFWIMLVFFMFFSVSFGQAVGAACANLSQASVINPFFSSFLILFAGVLSPPKSLAAFWRAWMYPIDPYHYFLEGVITDVLHGIEVTCSQDDLIPVPGPTNTTCGDYFQAYFDAGAPGYIANPTDSGLCQFCAYATGDEFYANYEWSYDNRWRDLGYLACYCVFNIFLVVGLIFLFRKPRR
ncbi:brefeldin A resistance protein [Blyttiomyces helicus]|uniref:Brefeldin A resistance protein n=1 Tax=Blyttiomyces helicus TaxID=388810 RepID=A0A4P9WL39_9FUNG|nr:brefeldin A resistance protein [Blyttiomyces helicus]|eukprot:RKO93102.1 brefeldin A resistance protein [Blyttiomyces helicus]